MKYCSECGKELNDMETVCPVCGATQQGMQPNMQQSMQPNMQQGMQPNMQQGMQPGMQPNMQKPSKKGKKTGLIIAIIVAVLAIGGLVAFLIIRNNKDDDEEENTEASTVASTDMFPTTEPTTEIVTETPMPTTQEVEDADMRLSALYDILVGRMNQNPTVIYEDLGVEAHNLVFAKLIDFNGDGDEQLVLIYDNFDYNYNLEIWDYINGNAECVYSDILHTNSIWNSMEFSVCTTTVNGEVWIEYTNSQYTDDAGYSYEIENKFITYRNNQVETAKLYYESFDDASGNITFKIDNQVVNGDTYNGELESLLGNSERYTFIASPTDVSAWPLCYSPQIQEEIINTVVILETENGDNFESIDYRNAINNFLADLGKDKTFYIAYIDSEDTLPEIYVEGFDTGELIKINRYGIITCIEGNGCSYTNDAYIIGNKLYVTKNFVNYCYGVDFSDYGMDICEWKEQFYSAGSDENSYVDVATYNTLKAQYFNDATAVNITTSEPLNMQEVMDLFK